MVAARSCPRRASITIRVLPGRRSLNRVGVQADVGLPLVQAGCLCSRARVETRVRPGARSLFFGRWGPKANALGLANREGQSPGDSRLQVSEPHIQQELQPHADLAASTQIADLDLARVEQGS